MAMTMKRTCYSCKAFEYMGIHSRCALGYKQDRVYYKGNYRDTRPAEPCPKPMTNNEYVSLALAQSNEQPTEDDSESSSNP